MQHRLPGEPVDTSKVSCHFSPLLVRELPPRPPPAPNHLLAPLPNVRTLSLTLPPLKLCFNHPEPTSIKKAYAFSLAKQRAQRALCVLRLSPPDPGPLTLSQPDITLCSALCPRCPPPSYSTAPTANPFAFPIH